MRYCGAEVNTYRDIALSCGRLSVEGITCLPTEELKNELVLRGLDYSGTRDEVKDTIDDEHLPLPEGWVDFIDNNKTMHMNSYTGEEISWKPKYPASNVEGVSKDLDGGWVQEDQTSDVEGEKHGPKDVEYEKQNPDEGDASSSDDDTDESTW